MKKIHIKSSAGRPYGEIPGNHYHDVDVELRRTASGAWVAAVLETWGSNQGKLEEHERKAIATRGHSLEAVVRETERRAEKAGIQLSRPGSFPCRGGGC
jgi:hypothetical protein